MGNAIPIVHKQRKSRVAHKVCDRKNALYVVKVWWADKQGKQAIEHHVNQISTAPDHEEEHKRYVYLCLVMTSRLLLYV